MIIGLFLIVAGVLIALFPQILVIMVSSTLVLAGVLICAVSWRMRQFRRTGQGQALTWWWRW